jgi:hypothetical protein
LQEVNTHTSVPESTKIVPDNQFPAEYSLCEEVTVLSRQGMEGTAVKNGTKEKTLQQKGTKSEENMVRPFMEIFFISVQQIQQGVVPDGADKGVGACNFMARQYTRPTRQSYWDDQRHVGGMPAIHSAT